MQTKYQVFISSTHDDLVAERDQVIKAVLEMGHIPVGMEMFSAADEEQWQIIARNIEESDYYCVVVAHRYGSLTPEGISYTQKEYEYAIAMGVPILGFVIEKDAHWPGDKFDIESKAVRALAHFKDLVRKKPVSFWRDAGDLYGRVSVALNKQMTANPREGWVRARSQANPEIVAELTRLSAENARLRRFLEEANSKVAADHRSEVEALWTTMSETMRELHYKVTRSDKDWLRSDPVSYATLFEMWSSDLATELKVDEAASTAAMELRKDRDKGYWTTAVNHVSDILADFMALGLVEPSKRNHGVKDQGSYWTLTPLGVEFSAYARVRRLERRREGADAAGEGSAVAEEAPTTKKAAAKKATAKTTAGKTTAGKTTAKKTTAKKTTAKKTTAKKTTAKKTTAK